MQVAQDLINQIEDFKQSITDEQYRLICDSLKKLSNSENYNVYYELTCLQPVVNLVPRYNYARRFKESRLETDINAIKWITRLKKCKCMACREGHRSCFYRDLYLGNNEYNPYTSYILDACEILPLGLEKAKKEIGVPYASFGKYSSHIFLTEVPCKIESIYLKSRKLSEEEARELIDERLQWSESEEEDSEESEESEGEDNAILHMDAT